MTVALYAWRKGRSLESVTVGLRHSRIHASDCAECETHFDAGALYRVISEHLDEPIGYPHGLGGPASEKAILSGTASIRPTVLLRMG